MKKINLIICFLILICFSFAINVNADDSINGPGVWPYKAKYPDNSEITVGEIGIGGTGYNYTNLLNPSNSYAIVSPNESVYLYVKPSNQSLSYVVGDVGNKVISIFYIISGTPLLNRTYDNKSCSDNSSACNFKNYIDKIRVYNMNYETVFPGFPNAYGGVYKIVIEWTIKDVLDTYPIGTGVGYDTAWVVIGVNSDSWDNIYSLNSVSLNDVTDVIGTPPSIIGEEEAKLSVWDTIKALPGKLLNWFTDLPGNIWNGIKTGFTWVTDSIGDLGGFILDLPSLTWDFFKHLPSSIFGVFSPAMNVLSDVGGFILDSINNLYQNDEIDIDLSDLSNVGGWLPPGPVDSILNLPFNFLNNLNNNLSKECTPVNIPLPYVNKNLPLPCVNSLYDSIPGLNVWISSTSIIIAGIIGFKYLINLYKWVDDTLSFRENNHLDNWGGL